MAVSWAFSFVAECLARLLSLDDKTRFIQPVESFITASVKRREQRVFFLRGDDWMQETVWLRRPQRKDYLRLNWPVCRMLRGIVARRSGDRPIVPCFTTQRRSLPCQR